ncbi:MAG TPA: hypothetical protein ENG14_00910 [Thermodesulforhabdus norvegica]|uniref:Helix-hairpin-helix domain-containing protein n=1 Tax=Thermodesulforhabdus norvegica TaxID=39841 RepID=A0A7C0WUF4_9BACT|nr:helix-hairpin-helix domain-containing protein [Deltaproteobacteria bacterium]MBW2068637.1 helix-hairpin-helix domain-containing protein [Deltaproteobacteria bacterium]HDL89446.1 hypothetical protein [Thermodesulforhabdus norvegica]
MEKNLLRFGFAIVIILGVISLFAKLCPPETGLKRTTYAFVEVKSLLDNAVKDGVIAVPCHGKSSFVSLSSIAKMSGIDIEDKRCGEDKKPLIESGDAVVVEKGRENGVMVRVLSMNAMFRRALGFPINVNTCPPFVLSTIPYLSDRIVEEIVKQRPFSKLDGLQNIKGIGRRKLSVIKAYLFCGPSIEKEKILCCYPSE